MHLNLQDDEGFEASCQQGRALGFDGKTLIHPKTIETANIAFAPSSEEVQQARRKIEAFAEAQAAGSALVVLGEKGFSINDTPRHPRCPRPRPFLRHPQLREHAHARTPTATRHRPCISLSPNQTGS